MHFLGEITLAGQMQPASFETTSEANWAEHAKLQGKPSLQRVGSKADTLSLTFHVHAQFQQPEQFLQRLADLKEAGAVLPLSNDAGDALGDWVIQSVATTRQRALPDGSIIEATVSVSLLEWVTVDGVSERKYAARRQGFAVGTQGVESPQLTQSLEVQAMESTLSIGGQADAIDSSLAAATTNPNVEEHARRTVNVRLSQIIADGNFARDTINAFGGQKYTDTRGMDADLLAVVNSAISMQSFVATANVSDLRGMVRSLTALNSTLRNTAQILCKYTGTRS